MSRKKFDAGWYAGSIREAKRAAYIAGAEAVLDLAAKVLDQSVKLMDKEPLSDSARNAMSALQMQVFQKLYQRAIEQVIARTPYEPPTDPVATEDTTA